MTPSIEEQKEVEYYAANVNAWISTRFEHDRSLLTLSAGAIGLLITLISTIGVTSIESLILHILALTCFVVCLSSVLWIFKRNAKHLADVIQDKVETDQVLGILDRTATLSFIAGIILTSIIGVSTSIHKYIEEETSMSENKEQGTLRVSMDSLNDIHCMRPPQRQNPTEGLSVDGIANLKPTSQPQPQVPVSKDNKQGR